MIERLIYVAAAAVCLSGGSAAHATVSGREPVRGVVRAEISATLSSELVAQIVQLPFKPGERFAAGDILVRFDCRRYEADLRAAAAEVQASAVTVKENRQLLRHGAGGSNELAISEAKLAKASAAVDSLNVRLSQCLIKAPFDGRVSERLADVYELPGANAPLLKVVKEGGLEIDLIVPSNWIVWLRPGKHFSFHVDETNSGYDAQITRIGAIVDPISRTLRVTGRMLGDVSGVRPGMSGSATFPTEQSANHGRD